MTNVNLVFGKNKVFIVDDFSDLEPFGEEQNLYVVRFKDDGTEETKAYEWRNNAYHPFTFGSGSNDNPTNDNVSVVIVDTRYDLPIPTDAKFSTLYVVLKDITAEHKTTMYIRVEDAYLLLAAFSAGGAVQEYTQVTKLGVMATVAAPKTYVIEIPRTLNFLRAPIEVLRFTRGNTGVVHSVITFDNGDESDFLPNDYVVFDGKMQLRTEFILDMQRDSTWSEEGSLHRKSINRDMWLRIDKVNVKDDGNYLSKTLISHDGEYKKFNGTNVINDVSYYAKYGKLPQESDSRWNWLYGGQVSAVINNGVLNLADPNGSSYGTYRIHFTDEADESHIKRILEVKIKVNNASPFGANSINTPPLIAINEGGAAINILLNTTTIRNGVATGTVKNVTLNDKFHVLKLIKYGNEKWEFYVDEKMISSGTTFEAGGGSSVSISTGSSQGTGNIDIEYIKSDRIFNEIVKDIGWEVVSSTLPTSQQFILDGMDNLSPLLDRKITELEPLKMADKSDILQDGEDGEDGKVFSKKLDLKKYLDIRSIKVEVR